MGQAPTVEEIISALKESGYLMEQEVASQLEALGFQVYTNTAYQDPEEGKSREIDVRAVKRIAYNEEKKIVVFAEMIVECKNNSNPFIFIERTKNSADQRKHPQEFLFSIPKYSVNSF